MTTAMPIRALSVLTGAVLLVHLLVLQYTPLTLVIDEPARTIVFTTRSLRINAAAEPPKAPSVRTVEARTRPGIARKPRANPTPRPAVMTQPSTPAASLASPEAPVAEVISEAISTPASAASAPATSEPAASPVVAAATEPTASAPEPASAPLPKDPARMARNYTVPGSIRLRFVATGLSRGLQYYASPELLWRHDGDKYEARTEVSAFLLGSRVFSSTGHLSADGLAPDRFSDKFRSERAAHFERDKGLVSFSANSPSAALLPGAQDRVSVFIQLAAMIAGDPLKFPVGTSISVQTVGPTSADAWIFTVETEEKQELPGGTLDTLKLTRSPRKQYDQKVEIWLAPSLAYLPARIRISDASGDFVDQQWRSTGAP